MFRKSAMFEFTMMVMATEGPLGVLGRSGSHTPILCLQEEAQKDKTSVVKNSNSPGKFLFKL